MRAQLTVELLLLANVTWMTPANAEWVEFVNESSQRLVADPERGMNDESEKDFALGDLDNDGDLDLVVMRKTESGNPCSGSLLCQNQLLMQEGTAEGHALDGVFVDRTMDYVIAADDGGSGFMDITNDRDVVLVDVNGDGWLDIVTAPAVSDALPKTISHPRVYMNLKDDGGTWQGFRYEQGRIPQLRTIPADLAISPRLCAIATADVNGDEAPDLYLGDYDGCASCPAPPEGHDMNDRLLINDGNGFFTDSNHTRMNEGMLSSGFTTSAVFADMNDDGTPDVVRNPVGSVTIAYNNPNNLGSFNSFNAPYNQSGYHVNVGDLNNDGLMDIFATDDGTDRYLLNQGNSPSGNAEFLTFPVDVDDGVGGNSLVVDLDNDGFNDVLVTDHDAEFLGCGGRLHIYRNLGDTPNITLADTGEHPWTPQGCHDIVTLDINNDGWKDMIIGTCSGTQIWMHEPFVGIELSVPEPPPAIINTQSDYTFDVSLEAIGGAIINSSSAMLNVSTNGGPFSAIPMTQIEGSQYHATIPASACGSRLSFYVSAETAFGAELFTDPENAPVEVYRTSVAAGTETVFVDDIESASLGWSVVNDPVLEGGAWVRAEPVATIFGTGLAAPNGDATAAPGTFAYVTENGAPGGAAGNSDVDEGPTTLYSPTWILGETDAIVSFNRWHYSAGGLTDPLVVEATNNGDDWVTVMEIYGPQSEWIQESFQVSEFLEPPGNLRLRFTIADPSNDSVTEAGIDDLVIDELICFLDTPVAASVGPRYLELDVVNGAGPFAVLVSGDPLDADVSCVSAYVQADGTLGSEPVFQDAVDWASPLLVSGDAVVPGKTYEIRYDTGSPGSPVLGPPVAAVTYAWGDVNDNGSTNFEDVLLVVQVFQGNTDNATVNQVDLDPCAPNQVVNFGDILKAVQAFQQVPFTASCPAPCG
ncbi:MAG: FG-GAP repeat domain-containing protein [Phycisphaerae bacterium]